MWAALAPLLKVILEVLIDVIFKSVTAPITAVDVRRDSARRERGPRVVLVPEGEPVQLAEPVKAHVYVNDGGQRVKSRNRVTLPEGWWALPDTDE
jgi:hypothetical protein